MPPHMAPSLLPGSVWASSLGPSSGRWTVLLVYMPKGIGNSHGFVQGNGDISWKSGHMSKAPGGCGIEPGEGRRETWNS